MKTLGDVPYRSLIMERIRELDRSKPESTVAVWMVSRGGGKRGINTQTVWRCSLGLMRGYFTSWNGIGCVLV
jgi:hypothetical protein